MKVLTLQLGEKTYTTARVTASMAKEAMRINKQAIDCALKSKLILNIDDNAMDLSDEELTVINDLSNAAMDLFERKLTLFALFMVINLQQTKSKIILPMKKSTKQLMRYSVVLLA